MTDDAQRWIAVSIVAVNMIGASVEDETKWLQRLYDDFFAEFANDNRDAIHKDAVHAIEMLLAVLIVNRSKPDDAQRLSERIHALAADMPVGTA